jgi:hypothetical protein
MSDHSFSIGDRVRVDWDWRGEVVAVLPDGYLSLAVDPARGGGMARVAPDRCEPAPLPHRS